VHKSHLLGCIAIQLFIIGTLKTSHIDDAIAALSIKLTNEEAEQLEASYTPRVDVNVKTMIRRLISQMSATFGIKIAVPAASK
jgi:hypothetical protein